MLEQLEEVCCVFSWPSRNWRCKLGGLFGQALQGDQVVLGVLRVPATMPSCAGSISSCDRAGPAFRLFGAIALGAARATTPGRSSDANSVRRAGSWSGRSRRDVAAGCEDVVASLAADDRKPWRPSGLQLG